MSNFHLYEVRGSLIEKSYQKRTWIFFSTKDQESFEKAVKDFMAEWEIVYVQETRNPEEMEIMYFWDNK